MVKVYRNLHRKCWSIKRGDEPVRWEKSLSLFGCSFKVWLGGRERVLRERAKRVHAFAVGKTEPDGSPSGTVPVTYNPYKAPYFFRKDTGEKVVSAKRLDFKETGEVFATID